MVATVGLAVLAFPFGTGWLSSLLLMCALTIHVFSVMMPLAHLPPLRGAGTQMGTSFLLVLCLAGYYRAASAAVTSIRGYQIEVVSSRSAHSVLPPGTACIVAPRAYDSSLPARGDIIRFYVNEWQPRNVERVVGVPGDIVEVRGGILYLNGRRLGAHELPLARFPLSRDQAYAVPPGAVLVLLTNLEMRPVPYRAISGKVVAIVDPNRFAGWARRRLP